MAILVDEKTKVLIQGITGREGIVRAQLLEHYGSHVRAGGTPVRGGADAYGIPVFESVEQAQVHVGEIDASVIFVPAALVKNAALEALAAGVKLLVIVPDRVPIYDVLEIAAAAETAGAKFVGPNTLGLLSPGKAVLGMIGGRAQRAREWFVPGPVGVTSRSGGMTSAISYYLTGAGFGQSTIVHVGGDPIIGTSHPEVVELFERDPATKVVALFGEIGSTQEERVADLIESGRFTKPLVAYIGGKAAKSGTRFSHAGAIIEGGKGTHASKVERLRAAGAVVVDAIAEIPVRVGEILKGLT